MTSEDYQIVFKQFVKIAEKRLPLLEELLKISEKRCDLKLLMIIIKMTVNLNKPIFNSHKDAAPLLRGYDEIIRKGKLFFDLKLKEAKDQKKITLAKKILDSLQSPPCFDNSLGFDRDYFVNIKTEVKNIINEIKFKTKLDIAIKENDLRSIKRIKRYSKGWNQAYQAYNLVLERLIRYSTKENNKQIAKSLLQYTSERSEERILLIDLLFYSDVEKASERLDLHFVFSIWNRYYNSLSFSDNTLEYRDKIIKIIETTGDKLVEKAKEEKNLELARYVINNTFNDSEAYYNACDLIAAVDYKSVLEKAKKENNWTLLFKILYENNSDRLIYKEAEKLLSSNFEKILVKTESEKDLDLALKLDRFRQLAGTSQDRLSLLIEELQLEKLAIENGVILLS